MPAPIDSKAAADLLAFIDASPTPYHAVATVRARLEAAGFRRFDEGAQWSAGAGGKGYVVRAGGSIVAFVLGSDAPETAGFVLVGAHTDSPTFRIKPNADVQRAGYHQLSIEVYGGVLLHTWLDRDLSIAGRVSLKNGQSHLVRVDRPICRISNLAIHLDRLVTTDGLKLNPQKHMQPTLSLTGTGSAPLAELLAAELQEVAPGTSASDIQAHDLSLYDTQRSAFGGRDGEFLHAARLDNLASCHAALTALLAESGPVARTRVVALYDHEEVGSQSNSGAKSRFLLSILQRLATEFPGASSSAAARALARSLLVSADMAHAVHPNYVEKHDEEHHPLIGAGPVIKVNANQSYATDSPAAATFASAAADVGAPVQHFVSRNDIPCGSTIGPISAATMGVRTVDVGNPMLSMHSCRETAGTADVYPMIAVMTQLLTKTPLPPPES